MKPSSTTSGVATPEAQSGQGGPPTSQIGCPPSSGLPPHSWSWAPGCRQGICGQGPYGSSLPKRSAYIDRPTCSSGLPESSWPHGPSHSAGPPSSISAGSLGGANRPGREKRREVSSAGCSWRTFSHFTPSLCKRPRAILGTGEGAGLHTCWLTCLPFSPSSHTSCPAGSPSLGRPRSRLGAPERESLPSPQAI